MSTLNQVLHYRFNSKQDQLKNYSALCKNPQKKGICLNVFIKNPKKLIKKIITETNKYLIKNIMYLEECYKILKYQL